MPVVNLPVHLLEERLGRPIEPRALVEHLQHLGCDVEGYEEMRRLKCGACGVIHEVTAKETAPARCDECGVDYRAAPDRLHEIAPLKVIRMELLPVRPDIFDPGGLARALRHYLELDLAAPRYALADPTLTVTVDPALARPESYRPYIACAVVRGLKLDEARVKVVMKLQENLHWALGRDRKFASIGVYDLKRIRGPRLRYRAVGPDERTFVPLGCGEPGLTPAAILAEHPKGQMFRHLLAQHTRYPLLEDSAESVLSMPPIINSEATRVTLGTTDFFIDVTGLAERVVLKTLAILTTSLAELNPRVTVEAVTIEYEDGAVLTPDLTEEERWLDPAATARLIGADISAEQVKKLLQRMGHRVEGGPHGKLRVFQPPYRNDLLHDVDLMEDVAIAYGFRNVEPKLVPSLTVGAARRIEDLSGVVRRTLAGLGLLEILSIPVTSPELSYDALGRARPAAEAIEISNPIHDDSGAALSMLRTDLLPGLLACLQRYRGGELPQRLFEVGDVTHLDEDAETGARELRRAAVVMIGPRAGFAEARSCAAALLRELGWALKAEPCEQPPYLAGRAARIAAVRGETELRIGHLGEIHPEVLERFGLGYPVAAFEIALGPLDGEDGTPAALKVPETHRTFL
ncbi:MAG: phenylalanine--tRNA ligase subunit beta [Planctomycetes bacterium]|nr:phenylalanine--tRNA ligase subunit beta [Planctomycetota bacterium]